MLRRRQPRQDRGRQIATDAGDALRPVKRLVRSKPTVEGAGVRLRRAFGFGNTADTAPPARHVKTSLIVEPGLCPVNRSHWHFEVLLNEIAGSFIEVRKWPVLEPCRR
jgi:hypothetical protein